MPESPRSPRNLYPGWPVSSTLGRDNVAHAMVQILAQRVFGESQRTSITDVAARWGMTASTVSDIVNGVVWPTVETLARLEVGLENPCGRACDKTINCMPLRSHAQFLPPPGNYVSRRRRVSERHSVALRLCKLLRRAVRQRFTDRCQQDNWLTVAGPSPFPAPAKLKA